MPPLLSCDATEGAAACDEVLEISAKLLCTTGARIDLAGAPAYHGGGGVRRIMPWKPALLVASALFVPGAARAQYQMVSPMLYNGPAISLRDHAARAGGAATPANPAAPRTVRPASLAMDAMRYRVDAGRRARNGAQFVAKVRATDPAGAEELAKLLADGLFDKIQAAVRPAGLRIDDLADAYALYWITAWDATQGGNPTPSARKLAAVKRQALDGLAAAPTLVGAGDAAKQELAEALWIQAMTIDGAVERAKGKPEALRAAGAAAAQGARAMGLDLRGMVLGEDGFRVG